VTQEPQSDQLHELERQVERGNLYAHTALTEQAARTNKSEALLLGLADLLVRSEVISADDLTAAVNATGRELHDAGRRATLDVAIRGDSDRPTISADEIDCDARIPYCKAVCCRLRWPLSVDEIENGPVKWDLGRPYFNRHNSEGYCHMIDMDTYGCTVYEQRPAPCREFSCKGDERIWKDFDAMVINQEWIDSHLTERTPIEIFISAWDSAEP
jgi:Fe-S-cluster containining protein